MSEDRIDLSYVLPLRRTGDEGLDELAEYLRGIASQVAEVIVVDGSSPELFARHRDAFIGARHIAPDAKYRFLMGKVDGVITGVEVAKSERVVIADDDVRYDRPALLRIAAELEGAELVRPQNFFDPLPWHAHWDTGRTLLNRVFTGALDFPQGDFPGTLAVRRSFFIAIGGYDGNVMFENLQLMRTVRAAGGRVATPLDLYVARKPPDTQHFFAQRVRQAYDDFAIPLRMAAFLAAAPMTLTALAAGHRRAVGAAAVMLTLAAETGRRRAGGAAVYPWTGALLAPVWVAERAVCAWLAVGAWRQGGINYGGSLIPRSGDSLRRLRRCYRRGKASGPLLASKPTSL